MVSGKTYLNITDDFDAEHIYNGIVFYYKNRAHIDIVEEGFKSDNTHHEWRELTLKFICLETEVKLTYYSFPSEIPKQDMPIHTLEMEIFGVEQARKDTIKRLESITGIWNIRDSIINR